MRPALVPHSWHPQPPLFLAVRARRAYLRAAIRESFFRELTSTSTVLKLRRITPPRQPCPDLRGVLLKSSFYCCCYCQCYWIPARPVLPFVYMTHLLTLCYPVIWLTSFRHASFLMLPTYPPTHLMFPLSRYLTHLSIMCYLCCLTYACRMPLSPLRLLTSLPTVIFVYAPIYLSHAVPCVIYLSVLFAYILTCLYTLYCFYHYLPGAPCDFFFFYLLTYYFITIATSLTFLIIVKSVMLIHAT